MASPPLTPDERRDRLVFYPVVVVAAVFCVTVLMTIAAAFGDPEAPMGKWLNQHATPLLLWETAALVIVSLLAMGLDRIRTLRRQATDELRKSATGEDAHASRGNHVG